MMVCNLLSTHHVCRWVVKVTGEACDSWVVSQYAASQLVDDGVLRWGLPEQAGSQTASQTWEKYVSAYIHAVDQLGSG
jgi:hypothetical protein